MNRIGLALAISLLSLGLAAPVTRPAVPLDPGLESQLRQIDAAARQIKDLSARFQQDKFTAMLKKPLTSTGTVRGAGSAIRWDTEQPEPCSLYTDQTQLMLYYPSQKLEEIYPIDQRMGDLLSSPLPRLKSIEEHFRIERAGPGDSDHAGTVTLRLTPSDAALAKHIREVTVVLDVKTGLTLRVQTVDADGDRTQITFSDMRPNSGMDPSRLELKVPGDTTISHPLDSAPAAQSPNGSP